MSACISRRGEYSSHEVDADYLCIHCGVLDEDKLIAELHKVRGERDALPVGTSVYGAQFDRKAERWAALENEHDRQHPDRGACGGVGACSMMRGASVLEQEMIEALSGWRVR